MQQATEVQQAERAEEVQPAPLFLPWKGEVQPVPLLLPWVQEKADWEKAEAPVLPYLADQPWLSSKHTLPLLSSNFGVLSTVPSLQTLKKENFAAKKKIKKNCQFHLISGKDRESNEKLANGNSREARTTDIVSLANIM